MSELLPHNERIRTALVGAAERQADMALEGQIVGSVVVHQLANGGVEVTHTGLAIAHTIGLLQIGLNIVISKAMSGK